ncbi:hypothetical protein NKR23_g11236 [Pleurostoma richardsiae]|uniref:C2H2-type domain-containing protein n=1 Tax=Pleurostoma richardsiae TaxID=41990 RepID=A0AA38RB16_9PEZI|nr:hypothetical protein NKR23_g11236 [Pleurostoma richardsiae]
MAAKQCTICNRQFSKTEHLRRHERSHTRERPYKCPVCHKSFARSDVLFRHCKKHEQDAQNAATTQSNTIHCVTTTVPNNGGNVIDLLHSAGRDSSQGSPSATSPSSDTSILVAAPAALVPEHLPERSLELPRRSGSLGGSQWAVQHDLHVGFDPTLAPGANTESDLPGINTMRFPDADVLLSILSPPPSSHVAVQQGGMPVSALDVLEPIPSLSFDAHNFFTQRSQDGTSEASQYELDQSWWLSPNRDPSAQHAETMLSELPSTQLPIQSTQPEAEPRNRRFVVMGRGDLSKLVCRAFPGLVKAISDELHASGSGKVSVTLRLTAMMDALLVLILASLLGHNGRVDQIESLYVNLMSKAQCDGFFSADEYPLSLASLVSIQNEERRWRVWGSVESVKRLTFHLIQLDCCPDILPSLLMLLQLRLIEASTLLDRLPQSSGAHVKLLPWKAFSEDVRSNQLAQLTINLAPAADERRKELDINCAISWHASCMMLGAYLPLFETAAGRYGPAAAVSSLKEISTWVLTPSARRCCLHAAQIFKLILNRKYSDAIRLHSMIALFQAALVLGLYVYAMPESDTGDMFDLYEEVDWVALERIGVWDGPARVPQSGAILMPAAAFVLNGGRISLGEFIVASGHSQARKCWLHFASLMLSLGRWKSRIFSGILHVMCDSLSDMDSSNLEDATEKST